jgi:hypothetical protein
MWMLNRARSICISYLICYVHTTYSVACISYSCIIKCLSCVCVELIVISLQRCRYSDRSPHGRWVLWKGDAPPENKTTDA